MPKHFLRLAAATVLPLAIISSASFAQSRLPTTQLSTGMYIIQAEVAKTETQRELGLMYRTVMPDNEGMVFDFGAPAGVCMWMKNTKLPLAVAFIDDDGKIINIEEMKPETLDSHCAKKPVRYALEMNQGWFSRKNIKPGYKIEGIPLNNSK